MQLKGLNFYKVDGIITRYSGCREVRSIGSGAWPPVENRHTFISLDGSKTMNILESELDRFNIEHLNSNTVKVLFGTSKHKERIT